MTNRFADRLQFETYIDEPPVGLALPPPGSEPDLDVMLLIPESLVARLIGLAVAYQLHHLPMVDVATGTRSNAIQRQGVIEELGFIASVVRDPALDEVILRIRFLVEDRRDLDLVVSGN